LMHPKHSRISWSHESVVLDISPSKNSSFIMFFPWYKIYFSSWPALPQKWQVMNITAVHPTKSIGNASKKVDYLPSSQLSSLCNHMGLHPLQDCKERRCQWSRKE
jgi:hypothetical protein